MRGKGFKTKRTPDTKLRATSKKAYNKNKALFHQEIKNLSARDYIVRKRWEAFRDDHFWELDGGCETYLIDNIIPFVLSEKLSPEIITAVESSK